MKKAMELSVLCDCSVAVVVVASNGRIYEYGSNGVADVLQQYAQAEGVVQSLNNASVRPDAFHAVGTNVR